MRYLFKYDRWLRDENCRCPSRVYVAAMPLSAADYRPRDAEHAVLYRVIDEHLEAFLETARRNADGSPLPEFVEQEFRDAHAAAADQPRALPRRARAACRLAFARSRLPRPAG